jgi:hypothetical protein
MQMRSSTLSAGVSATPGAAVVDGGTTGSRMVLMRMSIGLAPWKGSRSAITS